MADQFYWNQWNSDTLIPLGCPSGPEEAAMITRLAILSIHTWDTYLQFDLWQILI